MRKDLDALISVVPNFPTPGFLFKDISPLLRDRFSETVEAMLSTITADELQSIDAFVGLEARGFPLAAGMAASAGKGFVMARKKGKLPNPGASAEYELEYGSAVIEMQNGKGNVIVVDDVLATGGTLAAAANVSEKAGYSVKGMVTLINLKFLNNFNWNGMVCRSVLDYDGAGNLVKPRHSYLAP
jgi:adenine phosphoribosyltransferase